MAPRYPNNASRSPPLTLALASRAAGRQGQPPASPHEACRLRRTSSKNCALQLASFGLLTIELYSVR